MNSIFVLRKYRSEDLDEVLELFFQSVHVLSVNEYCQKELDAWAPEDPDRDGWQKTLSEHESFVALFCDEIVGFGDFAKEANYVDRLYTKPGFEHQGVGTMLLERLESLSDGRDIFLDASRTALPFFLNRGYVLIENQIVERRGVEIENFRMKKGGL